MVELFVTAFCDHIPVKTVCKSVLDAVMRKIVRTELKCACSALNSDFDRCVGISYSRYAALKNSLATERIRSSFCVFLHMIKVVFVKYFWGLVCQHSSTSMLAQEVLQSIDAEYCNIWSSSKSLLVDAASSLALGL